MVPLATLVRTDDRPTDRGIIVARRTPVQLLLTIGVAAGLAWLVVTQADGWADWVVFAAIVLTFLGFAIAAHQRVYAPRERSISRTSDD